MINELKIVVKNLSRNNICFSKKMQGGSGGDHLYYLLFWGGSYKAIYYIQMLSQFQNSQNMQWYFTEMIMVTKKQKNIQGWWLSFGREWLQPTTGWLVGWRSEKSQPTTFFFQIALFLVFLVKNIFPPPFL